VKKIVIILSIIFFSGCATLNFSSKYYKLPPDYKKDIQDTWNEIKTKVPLKYKAAYSYRIVKDKETSLAGVPEIHSEAGGYVILIPEYYIMYVWEFYYPLYHKQILACLIAHEMGHAESGLSDKTKQEHLACDQYSIGHLLLPGLTGDTFYSSLVVTRHYWSARKGVGGHLFNIGWNAVNIASLVFGGPASIGDLFVTDLDYRISRLRKGPPKRNFIFKRNS